MRTRRSNTLRVRTRADVPSSAHQALCTRRARITRHIIIRSTRITSGVDAVCRVARRPSTAGSTILAFIAQHMLVCATGDDHAVIRASRRRRAGRTIVTSTLGSSTCTRKTSRRHAVDGDLVAAILVSRARLAGARYRPLISATLSTPTCELCVSARTTQIGSPHITRLATW